MHPWLNKINKPPLPAMLITVAVGVVLVSLPLLAWLSYDVSYLFRPLFAPPNTVTNVAIIYANEITARDLGDGDKVHWTNHARLLNRLTQDGARLVLYDFVFAETNRVAEFNQALADAIKRHGSVVLVRPKVERDDAEILGSPAQSLDEAAIDAGHGELFDERIRRLPQEYLGVDYAGWIVASRYDSNRLKGQNPNHERWLNYGGLPPNLGLPTFHFEDVISNKVPPGAFAQKIVVVGATSSAGSMRAHKDTFATPYTLFNYKPAPGAGIHATAILNLVRGEWLLMLARPEQYLLVSICGTAVAGLLNALSRKRKLVLVVATILSAALIASLSLYVQWQYHVWWNWLAGAIGQTAVSLIWVWWHPRPDPYFVFISYRTEDDIDATQIHAELERRGYKAFVASLNMKRGPFSEQILRAIEEATFFVPILSPNSLTDCTNNEDWVLMEIRHALQNKSHDRLVPSFIRNFSWENEKNLPNRVEIEELRRLDGVSYGPDGFMGFMDRLIKRLTLP